MPLVNWIRGFVFGVLKQSPLSIDSYTMAGIYDAYVGHRLNENITARVQWETARFISFVNLKAAGSKRLSKPSDLITFDWEKNEAKKGEKGNPWTRDEIEKLKKTKPKWFN
jgi:hypothetical protein